MSNGVFNHAKGAIAEKVRDAIVAGQNTKILVYLYQATEAEAALIDRASLAEIKAPGTNTEATFTNYAPKTGLVGAYTVDTTNDRVDVDITTDQTWTAAGGATNNTLTKLIVLFEDSASDTGRIPLTHHDFNVVTDGSDLTAQFNAVGFFRAT
jgi:hypothetical protein